jgi:hypothetical protein
VSTISQRPGSATVQVVVNAKVLGLRSRWVTILSMSTSRFPSYPVDWSDRLDGQVLDGRRAGPNVKVLTPGIPGGWVSMGKSCSHDPALMEGVKEGWNKQAQIGHQCQSPTSRGMFAAHYLGPSGAFLRSARAGSAKADPNPLIAPTGVARPRNEPAGPTLQSTAEMFDIAGQRATIRE